MAFAHGDYHPLNVIWTKAGIAAVIDWEFSGLKPEMYDAAILVGCLAWSIRGIWPAISWSN